MCVCMCVLHTTCDEGIVYDFIISFVLKHDILMSSHVWLIRAVRAYWYDI